jgi:hypothetical protein
LHHCIYCHKTFNSELSGAYDCKIQHFGEPEGEDECEFTCCGRKFSYVDCNDWHEFLEMPEETPYCFEGRHTTVPWKRGDDKVEEDEDHYGDEDEAAKEGRTRWWEEIWKAVGNCEKLKCKKKMLL